MLPFKIEFLKFKLMVKIVIYMLKLSSLRIILLKWFNNLK